MFYAIFFVGNDRTGRRGSAGGRDADGSRTIRLALRLIAAAAVIGLSAPASALTPQQCAAIKGSFIKGMQYQMKALEQGKLLVQQKPIILSIILSLRTKYPDLKDADLEDFRKIGDRVNDAALALDNEADMKAHQDAALVIRDLCP